VNARRATILVRQPLSKSLRMPQAPRNRALFFSSPFF
jgi:hypothetical protein